MLVGVLGINHNVGSLKLREEFARACQRLPLLFNQHDHSQFFVLLSTCNRTEIYFHSQDLASTQSYLIQVLRQDLSENIDQKLYTYFGTGCVQHLYRVTAGLDSAILFETDVQHQVKKSYEIARQNSPLSKELHFLFQKALFIAKKVRVAIRSDGCRNESVHCHNLGNILFNQAKRYFSQIDQVKLLFIGASEINWKLFNEFKSKGLSSIGLCNRSYGASPFFKDSTITFLPWSALRLWHEYDWVICGTKCPDYLLTREQIENRVFHQPKLLIDLSVPRNIEPKLSGESCIRLYNIDQLQKSAKNGNHLLKKQLEEAELLVELAAQNSVKKFISNSRGSQVFYDQNALDRQYGQLIRICP